jgi:hypothetical protein
MQGILLGRPWGPIGGHACYVLSLWNPRRSAENTAATPTEAVPVDQSSLCNIDHLPNFKTQDDLAGAFGSGGQRRPSSKAASALSGPAQATSHSSPDLRLIAQDHVQEVGEILTDIAWDLWGQPTGRLGRAASSSGLRSKRHPQDRPARRSSEPLRYLAADRPPFSVARKTLGSNGSFRSIVPIVFKHDLLLVSRKLAGKNKRANTGLRACEATQGDEVVKIAHIIGQCTVSVSGGCHTAPGVETTGIRPTSIQCLRFSEHFGSGRVEMVDESVTTSSEQRRGGVSHQTEVTMSIELILVIVVLLVLFGGGGYWGRGRGYW